MYVWMYIQSNTLLRFIARLKWMSGKYFKAQLHYFIVMLRIEILKQIDYLILWNEYESSLYVYEIFRNIHNNLKF